MANNILKRNLPGRIQNLPFSYTEKDFNKYGWLKKQGGKFKTMKRRYFVLLNEFLYYFTNETRNTLKGQINLRNLELSDLEEDRGSGEFSFFILPEIGHDCVSKTHEKFQFICQEKENAESWLQQIKQNMYLHRGGGLFGTPLDTVRKYLKSEYGYVPRVVHECCQQIRLSGIDEEGIFRKNGQQSLVYQLKANVDRAQYNFNGVDIHTVCSLLKLYLRELPQPLIPFCEYDSLKAVGYRIDIGEDLDLVRTKLRALPPPNLQLLKYLCEFLHEVSTHRKNRMEIDSLAKVFSPNILRHRDTDPYIEESSSSLISFTVAAFIKKHAELFVFEYEPLETDEGEVVKDEDTYSVASLSSNIGFLTACLNFDDINNDSPWSPEEYPTSNRVKSMIIGSVKESSVNHSFCNHSQSIDNIDNIDKCNQLLVVPPMDRKVAMKLNTDSTKPGILDQSIKLCSKCQNLEQQLISVTTERDELLQLCCTKSELCVSLQKEVEDLRLQLSENVKAKTDNDLSEVLAYFKMNR